MQPDYTLLKLQEKVVNNLKDYNNLQLGATANKWLDKFNQLDEQDRKVSIQQIFNNQSEFLFNSMNNNVSDIYIPFIGKLEVHCYKTALEQLKSNDENFDVENNKELIKQTALDIHNSRKHKDLFVKDIPNIQVDNLGEVLKMLKKNRSM